MADTTKMLCPHCKKSFGTMEEPCRKCEGTRLVKGAKKDVICPRCNGNAFEISAKNRHNRSKGAANERKAVAFFTDFWLSPTGEKYAWRKTPQSGGMSLAAEFKMSGDIATTAPDFNFGVECKRDGGWSISQLFNSTGRILEFIDQVENDNLVNGKIPMLWLMNPGPSQPTWILLIAHNSTIELKIQRLNTSFDIGIAKGAVNTKKGCRAYALMTLDSFTKYGADYWRKFCNGD